MPTRAMHRSRPRWVVNLGHSRARRAFRGVGAASLCLATAACICGRLCPSPAPAGETNAPVKIDAAPERLPVGRHGHRLEILDGRLFAFGGFAAGSLEADRGSRETMSQDLTLGGWRRESSLHRDLAFAGSAVVNGSIYALGDGIERLDKSGAPWAVVAPEGTLPRSHFGAAAIGSKVYALGGFPTVAGGFAGFDLAAVKSFDPPEPPGFDAGDHFHIVVALDGRLHAIGGIRGKDFDVTRDHWVFDGRSWTPAAPPPAPLWAKFSAIQTVGNSVYIFESKRGYRYDAIDNRWNTVAGLPRDYCMPASVHLGRSIVVMGGMSEDDRRNDLLIYDLDADSWREVPRAAPSTGPAAAARSVKGD